MATIASRLQQVQHRIESACAAAGRPAGSVTLLAVSKTCPAERIREAHAAGQTRFGENYVQEALAKIEQLADLRSALEWHLIGPLQSNKTRAVAEHFDWVHSIDRLKLAERLSAQRPPQLGALQICLQVNISGEASKSGLMPGDVAEVARAVARLPGLALRGLMAIPEPAADAQAQRAPHRALRELLRALQQDPQLVQPQNQQLAQQQNQQLAQQQNQLRALRQDPQLAQQQNQQFAQRRAGPVLDTLSMGMSADLEAAVAEGATLVRVGTAIFGARAT